MGGWRERVGQSCYCNDFGFEHGNKSKLINLIALILTLIIMTIEY